MLTPKNVNTSKGNIRQEHLDFYFINNNEKEIAKAKSKT